jgi:hypothetical protein
MLIQIRSKFLKDYFCSDDVTYDIFSAAYRSTIKVLNNPELYPKADLNFYSQLEFELTLESPTWCK